MTRYELLSKPVPRQGFEWNGTLPCIRGHLSDAEWEAAQPRLCRDEHGPYLMINTLHDWSRVRPGDWIVIVEWPLTGIEVYGIKAHVREVVYSLGTEIDFDPVED